MLTLTVALQCNSLFLTIQKMFLSIPAKKRNTYIVVLHLIRRPSSLHKKKKKKKKKKKIFFYDLIFSGFRSCLEARRYGYRRTKLTIYPRGKRGKKYRVKCNQRVAGGGWTRVLDMNH